MFKETGSEKRQTWEKRPRESCLRPDIFSKGCEIFFCGLDILKIKLFLRILSYF
jgi:hypothetical protein